MYCGTSLIVSPLPFSPSPSPPLPFPPSLLSPRLSRSPPPSLLKQAKQSNYVKNK